MVINGGYLGEKYYQNKRKTLSTRKIDQDN